MNIQTNQAKPGLPNGSWTSRLHLDCIFGLLLKTADKLVINRLIRIEDADASVNTLDMPFRFYPCLAAGLAYYIALKRAS